VAERRSSAASKRSPAARVVVDSGPLIALFNANDTWHETVVSWLAENPQVRLTTTWPVVTEVCALLARRIANDAALDFLRWAQRGAIDIDQAMETTLDDIVEISVRFQDMPFDLADASVAEAAARLGLSRVLTIASDFDVYRNKAGKALTNALRSSKARR
jgi:predicted nucleic acid-binding protein